MRLAGGVERADGRGLGIARLYLQQLAAQRAGRRLLGRRRHPNNQVQATLDLHPTRLPLGATLTVNNVGERFDTVGGFGTPYRAASTR
jgi:hypothetical protein